MTLNAPTEDFTEILDQIGQSIVVRTLTRTIDVNGNVTAVTPTDVTASAVVQEVSMKEKIFLQAGLVDIGDIMYFVAPNTSITIYDLIVWNTVVYKVRKILLPPRIGGFSGLLYKQILTIRDSTS